MGLVQVLWRTAEEIILIPFGETWTFGRRIEVQAPLVAVAHVVEWAGTWRRPTPPYMPLWRRPRRSGGRRSAAVACGGGEQERPSSPSALAEPGARLERENHERAISIASILIACRLIVRVAAAVWSIAQCGVRNMPFRDVMTEQRWRCYSAAMPKLPDLSFVRALGSAWCGDGVCCVACPTERAHPTTSGHG